MQLLDKVKVTENWMINLRREVRDFLNVKRGDFIVFIVEGNKIILKTESLDDLKQNYEGGKNA